MNQSDSQSNQFPPASQPTYRLNESFLGNIPDVLKERDQWVVWRYELGKKGKWTKVPYQSHALGVKASTTDPQTWNTFEETVRAYRRSLKTKNPAAGVGFVFANDGGLVGFDLDGIVTEEGEIEPWGAEILNQLTPTYHEISPSGCGIKGIVRGHLPSAVKKTGLGPDGRFGLELYDVARFFTITGDALDVNRDVLDRQDRVLALHAQYKRKPHEGNGDAPHGPPRASDAVLLDYARKTKDPRLSAFSALFDRAEIRRTHSDADFHLCCILAFWFNRDAESIDRVFRCSKLMREKWDEPRGETTYGAMTVANAIDVTSAVYSPEHPECPDALETKEWPPLRLGMLPPPGVFPIDVFPRPCVTMARAVAKAVGCDIASVGGAMLAIAGGVIGRTVHLRVKENWIVQPIIFHANVADPGAGKTWAIRYLTDGYLSRIEEEFQSVFDAEKKIYHAKCKEDKRTQHAKPIPKQLLIDDSTVEAMFVALKNNPRGLLSVLDELTVLFAGLNQYKGGKGADRSHFLKLWTGSRISINRIRNEFGEPLRIPFPHLSITGNIPPDNLPMILGPHGNDGMLDRWLFTYPDWNPKLKASERGAVPGEVLAGWNSVIKKLWNLKVQPAAGEKGEHPYLLDFDKDGQQEFFRRSDELTDEFNDPSFPHSLRGPWSKLETYAGRFALVLHVFQLASQQAHEWAPVGFLAADGAWQLVDYFKGEHKRVVASLQDRGGSMPEGARLHLNWIKSHANKDTFSESNISSSYSPNKGYTPAMMADGRLWLQERYAIRRAPSTVPKESTPGRKPAPLWEIHPDLRTSGHSGRSGE